jgi:glycosyltransferase involved in cell wall biosynthesis
VPYIIREPENGIVLDEITTETVASGLRRLLGDSRYCSETGAHNAQYAWENFGAKVVTANIEAVYHDIANS